MNDFRRALLLSLLFSVGCSGPQTRENGTMTNPEVGGSEYAEAMAKEHADDKPDPTPVTEPAAEGLPTQSSEVEYATIDGKKVTGYHASPSVEGEYPGVILIHEWWGLNDNIRAMADKLAAQGYHALAVDLYGGQVATTPDQAKTIMQSVQEAQGVDNLRQARTWLADVANAGQIGVMGWCFGGGWALTAGLTQGEAIDAVVMYYGRVKTKPEEVKPLEAPVLGLFGAEDQGIPVAQVKEFEAALQRAGENATIHVYEGAGHAFANPSGQNYQEQAAKDAWDKTLAFLAKHLKDEG